MEKVIHYCWFGGKPLPKLAKKCIKSWKKFLPDYKIIEWNEKNFDINCTDFSKKAYEEKKYAFVSDVARTKALKEYGGIYFDTDMLVTKNIDHLLSNEFFAGWESEYNIAVGVLGVAHKNHPIINQMWEFYCENDFDVDNVFSLSIPTILSGILKSNYDLVYDHLKNQYLGDGVCIYARDYFYPIGSDASSEQMFTENTCMVHYYIGSWLPDWQKKRIKFRMALGKKLGDFVLDILVICKHLLKAIFSMLIYPAKYVRNRIKHKNGIKLVIDKFREDIDSLTSNDYIAFYNNNWFGTQNATKALFDNTIGISEIEDDEIIDSFAKIIANKGFNLVIFSAFSFGWDKLVKKIKEYNSSICIKAIWHGSNALNTEYYDFNMFETIFKLYNGKYLDNIAFVKKSMFEFYKLKGYDVEFIANTVKISDDEKSQLKIDTKYTSKGAKIGLYASGDRWVKNFYNQLAAASLFKDVKIDCIPLSEKAVKMGKILDVNVLGLYSSIPKEKLWERMMRNDINLYVTFTECAPLIPLESFELGVPCITGDNHHYWEGTKLRDYLVVSSNDNAIEIYNKAVFCLEHKDEIMALYKEWKKDYDLTAIETVESFLKNRDISRKK